MLSEVCRHAVTNTSTKPQAALFARFTCEADSFLQVNGYGPIAIEETAAGSRIFQIAPDLILNGTTASDVLNGGSGTDLLIGGLGADRLTGGAGNDIFKFNILAEIVDYSYETITDFAVGDQIDLSGLDANSTLEDDQAFSFTGNSSFTGVAGQLQLSSAYIRGDIDGDAIMAARGIAAIPPRHSRKVLFRNR